MSGPHRHKRGRYDESGGGGGDRERGRPYNNSRSSSDDRRSRDEGGDRERSRGSSRDQGGRKSDERRDNYHGNSSGGGGGGRDYNNRNSGGSGGGGGRNSYENRGGGGGYDGGRDRNDRGGPYGGGGRGGGHSSQNSRGYQGQPYHGGGGNGPPGQYYQSSGPPGGPQYPNYGGFSQFQQPPPLLGQFFGPPPLLDRSREFRGPPQGHYGGQGGGRDNNNRGGDYRDRDDRRRASYDSQACSFSIDTKPDRKSTPADIPRNHFDFYNNVILGTTHEETAKFHQNHNSRFMYREPPPLGIDKDGNLLQDDLESSPKDLEANGERSDPKKPRKRSKSVEEESESTFIPFAGVLGGSGSSRTVGVAGVGNRESPIDLKDKIEYYNSQLRESPNNIPLWKEFVEFQDKFFEVHNDPEESQGREERDRRGKKTKKRGNRKALIEKKISILEKAIESNPRSLDLHVLRLDLIYEIYKPRFVLTEWKKLVTTYQQIPAFWIEYLRFAATQLQLYTSTQLIETFAKCFEKFRLMLNPNYPEFQRPEKFPLLLADFSYGLSASLKNAGYSERAFALQQAQLEMNFNLPSELAQEAEPYKEFEGFWRVNSPRFGETGAPGWAQVSRDGWKVKEFQSTGLSESQISDFEDLFFGDLMEKSDQEKEAERIGSWLTIEGVRSKVFWSPWRGQDDPDDSNRVVGADHVTPFLVRLPHNADYITEYGRDAAHFRNVLNFALLIQEDFLARSHTLELLLPTFTSLALTESTTLFTEYSYWKKFLDFYHKPDPKTSQIIPEGFRLLTHSSSTPATPFLDTTFSPDPSSSLSANKSTLFSENYAKSVQLLRNLVTSSIDHLPKPFASLLTQLLFKYEQRACLYAPESAYKSTLKFLKGLLQHEKLRNEPQLYGEVSIFEFFTGKRQKAIDLLVKTVNSAAKSLTEEIRDQSGSELNLDCHWESVTELARLYRLLAQLFLQDDPEIAKNVLISLGKAFQPVVVSPGGATEPKDVLRARRFYEKVMEQVLPSHEGDLERWGGDQSLENLIQRPNLLVEWTHVFGLFQLLTSDFGEVKKVFEGVFEVVPMKERLSRANGSELEVVIRSNIREQLHISYCQIGAFSLGRNSMENSGFRTILANALGEFPSSPPLLLLFTDVENQCSIAGRLWRIMINEVKCDKGKSVSHWAPLFMGLGLARKIEEIERDTEIGNEDFGIGGPAVAPDTLYYKLDSLLSAAEASPSLRNTPLIWRVHLKHLALRAKSGKDAKVARATFYEAIRHCPSVKSLYLDAMAYFPEMSREIMDLINEKGLLVRLPFEELDLLLEKEEDGEKKERKESGNSEISGNSEEKDAGDEEEVKEVSDGEVE